MTIQIHTNISDIKPRLLKIGKKYQDNEYYKDNPKRFSFLVMLYEDYPKTFSNKLESDIQHILIKQWIDQLFSIDNDYVKELTLTDKVNLILNNIVELPTCKCSTKLKRILASS